MSGPATLSASAAHGAAINAGVRTATMPEFEKEPRAAGSNQIGPDLETVRIEHYAVHDRPDLVPDTVSYYSAYRLATPERVLFFKTANKIVEQPEGGIDVDIAVYPFSKEGEGMYNRQPSGQFTAAELDRVREIITDYLKADPKALHPILAPRDRVRNVRVRFA
jgi:hypothetical protein